MQIHTKPLYPQMRAAITFKRVPLHIKLLLSFIVAVLPYAVIGTNPSAPYEQEFVLTAYYSPLPGQCCYVKGGLKADKILNGEGHTAADGTGVYPGMIAAPPNYRFGTVVNLPGLGTFKVHDRGGAIQVLGNGAHRLDVWAGHGEEGLARALAFGVKRIKGTVYPVGSNQLAVQVDLTSLPTPVERLEDYKIHSHLYATRTRLDERTLTAKIMQDHLRELGYLDHPSTGYYGPMTQEALAAFIRDYQLNEDPNVLSERTGAHLLAAVRRKLAGDPVSGNVNSKSKPKRIMEAQRILRFLGYYRGRTDGRYSDQLFAAILKFQQQHYLVGTAQDPGAGQIGPITMRALQGAWNRRLVAYRAQKYLTVAKIDSTIKQRGRQLDSFLGEGYYGDQVRILQQLLAERGFFPAEKINGNFGPLTKQAVTQFQLDRNIIKWASAGSAGYVGKQTLTQLQREQREKYYNWVRAEGWGVL